MLLCVFVFYLFIYLFTNCIIWTKICFSSSWTFTSFVVGELITYSLKQQSVINFTSWIKNTLCPMPTQSSQWGLFLMCVSFNLSILLVYKIIIIYEYYVAALLKKINLNNFFFKLTRSEAAEMLMRFMWLELNHTDHCILCNITSHT